VSKTLNLALWGTVAIGGLSWFACLKALGGEMKVDNRSSFVLYVMIFSLAIQLPRIFGAKLRWIQVLEVVAVLGAGFFAGALLAFHEGPKGIIPPAIYIISYILFLLLIRVRAKQPEGELVE
jgi:hypothetical protein